jgi:glycosyltransferase involved in cell wall biosynthesis
VIVVEGPSTDGTAERLAALDGAIRRVDNPERNLSRSRNLGIEAAAGDVVAFLDDDAVPEPRWLEDLVAAFEDELAPYEVDKGTIRFPLSEPVPVKLIERIARFRADQLTTREKPKGGRRKGREAQLERVRRLCTKLPSVSEKLSHGTPTFFVEKDKGVFAMFADNHHEDGRLALWVPVPQGLQPLLIEDAPATYFKPPYVGSSGWVGIRLDQIRDDALQIHMREAWGLAAGTRKKRRPQPRRRRSE